jgi:hypothetical protein
VAKCLHLGRFAGGCSGRRGWRLLWAGTELGESAGSGPGVAGHFADERAEQSRTKALSGATLLSVTRRGHRFALYGLLGCCAEVVFTAIVGFFRQRDDRLTGQTSLWMFPIYGLIEPLYEPLHDALRERLGAAGRGLVYALGFLAVEYVSGRVLRAAVGEAPWDYSHARHHLHGLIRLDYLPLWAGAGLALEPLHDRLTRRT